MALDAVEVRTDPSVNAWYSAIFEDVAERGILCSFEDDIWPQAVFPAEDVRLPAHSRGREDEDFDPAVGEFVEMELPGDETAPSGWRRARVRNRQRQLYLVQPTERLARGARGEVVLPRWKLRAHRPLRGGLRDLHQAEIDLSAKLAEWITTPEAAAAIGSVGQLSARSEGNQLLKLKPDLEKQRALVIGTESAVRRMLQMLPPVLSHNLHVKQFDNALEIREKALEARKAQKRSESGAAAGMGETPELKCLRQFEADATHVARLIGRGGSNVNALQQIFGVKFQILDGPSFSEAKVVKILGPDEDSVQKALDSTQLVEEWLPVPPEMNGWVIGRNFSTAADFRNRAGLQACRLDREGNRLVFEGTRQACQQAKQLYTAHMLYFETFKGMDEQLEELMTQLQEYGDIGELLKWSNDFSTLGGGGPRASGKGKGGKPHIKGKSKDSHIVDPSVLQRKGGKGKFKGKAKDQDGGKAFPKGKQKGGQKGGSSPGNSQKGFFPGNLQAASPPPSDDEEAF